MQKLSPYNFKKDPPLTPRKAMREMCKSCVCYENAPRRIKECELSDCPIWPYRHGRGVETPEGMKYAKTGSAEGAEKARKGRKS